MKVNTGIARYLNLGSTSAIRKLSLSLSVLCALCGGLSAQEWKTAQDGVEYAQVEHKLGNDPIKINLLRLDLKKVRLDVHHALDKAIGLETTSSIAKRKGAVAAINSGFFRLDKSEFAGDAVGVLMIDSEPLSEPFNNRIALAITNLKRDTLVDLVRSEQTFAVRIGARIIKLSGINREPKENDTLVFTHWFPRTSLPEANGIEICVVKDRVSGIAKSAPSLVGPCDVVISASGTAVEELSSVKVGDPASMAHTTFLISNPTGGFPFAAEDVVGGVPQLIRKGRIDITWQEEKASKSFVETRHPRTAVAKMKDGKFLMMTVDGRQPGVSVGMTLQELAEYLLSLGAVDAMNLDGGGSTTMFLDGKVVNNPSDKEGERKVGDAILVTLRKVQKPARQ